MRMLSGAIRRPATATVLTLVAAALAACGSDTATGPPVLNWYINNLGQVPIAEACAANSGGAYNIEIQLLPNAASGQREQLLRRLAANDRSIDVMSLDPPFMAEFANAGFLRAFTEEEEQEFSENVLDGPLEQSLFNDRMYSAPFYGNTQLLWYKLSTVQQTGLDPEAGPVTWQQLIDAASAADLTIGVQGRRNESYMVWVNALVESAGGSILDPSAQTAEAADVQPTIDSPAGRAAAEIMSSIAASPAAPPALSTAGEEQSRAAFQAENGGYMVNWPYVWAAFDAAIEEGAVAPDFKDDVGWTRYPEVEAGTPSAPPLGGIGLSVGAFSNNPDLAVEAIRCLRSEESQTAYMLGVGDPGASSLIYDDPAIREAFPMADDLRDGLNEAAPRPVSPYYGDITSAVQRAMHPPEDISPETAPGNTASLIRGVLTNQQLL